MPAFYEADALRERVGQGRDADAVRQDVQQVHPEEEQARAVTPSVGEAA